MTIDLTGKLALVTGGGNGIETARLPQRSLRRSGAARRVTRSM
jgi:hypothetical protein